MPSAQRERSGAIEPKITAPHNQPDYPEGEQCKPIACLLHGAEESRRSGGNAFVCRRWPWVRHSTYEISNYRVASVDGKLAEDNRDDFAMIEGLDS